jgi:uncharacterized protein
MRPEILKAVIDFFCSDQDDIEFIWHGGEPLLAGLKFYREAVEIQRAWRQQGKKITNFLQANATLITPEWVRFFKENDFLIGVSLDGPKEFHDQVRCYSTGKGSYDEVMRGIDFVASSRDIQRNYLRRKRCQSRIPKRNFQLFYCGKYKKVEIRQSEKYRAL